MFRTFWKTSKSEILLVIIITNVTVKTHMTGKLQLYFLVVLF